MAEEKSSGDGKHEGIKVHGHWTIEVRNPNGTLFSYNPIYFATPDAAAHVARMLGGKVVETNEFTSIGSPFVQQQPNQMVQMPDGRMINAGLVAAFYTHGYPQSYINGLIAQQINGTNV